MVTKEEIWRGIKQELSRSEILKILPPYGYEYEEDDYYDYDLLLGGLYKMLNKEVEFDYFIDWCILIAKSLEQTKVPAQSKLRDLYDDVAYFFDGISFMDNYDAKLLLQRIAELKHYNFLIKKAKKESQSPFLSDGVERLMFFDHCNRTHDSSVYRVIIKDYNRKCWQLRYVDTHNFTFDDKINYTFESKDKFDNIFAKFYDDEYEDWREVQNLKF